MTGPSHGDVVLTMYTGERTHIRACEVRAESTSTARFFKRVQQSSSKTSRTRIEGQGTEEGAEDVRRYVDGQ